jgi:hypothetical protein
MNTGVRRRAGASRAAKSTKRKSRRTSKSNSRNVRSRSRRPQPKGRPQPKVRSKQRVRTARILSKKSKSFHRHAASRAHSTMTMTELQFMAASRGVPFGGLNKTRLAKKINNYYP